MDRLLLLAAALVLAAPLPAFADDDHERALAAVERGDALPLDEVLAQITLREGERLIDVELERDDGRWVYELELIDTRGRVRELELDALTAEELVDD